MSLFETFLLWIVLVGGTVAIYALTRPRRRHADVPIGPRYLPIGELPLILVIAESEAQAKLYVGHIPPNHWRFVSSEAELIGYRPDQVEIRLEGAWWENPLMENPRTIALVRALGAPV
jgi:hypothetical protein